MSDQNPSPFQKLVTKILGLPLWIKQVVYAELKSDLESSAARFTIELINKDDTLPLYVPQISFLGRKEIETRSRNLTPANYSLLDGADKEKRILDICLQNNWTLEACAIQMMACMDLELVAPPRSAIISGTAQYIAGRIRLGEYLIKLNKITIDQLDQALRTQKYIEHSIGERTGIGEVLINLGYITKTDSESILFLKEESKKKYIPELFEEGGAASGSKGTPQASDADFKKLQRENMELREKIEKAMFENNQLREQLRKILKLK